MGTEFSISAIEIEQTSTGTTKPTIWVGGDSIAASRCNAPEDAVHGRINDTAKYPLPKSRWFSDAFDLCMMKRELLKSN